MKIEEGNANKKTRINKRFSISIILALVIFMINGSAATMSYATTQTLPTCVDPTGHNLPCIMFISTLPPPKHTVQCQETSGQIFKCTFIVEKLSNGNKVVSITVYVPANTIVKNTESFRVVGLKVTIHTSYSCPPGRHLVGRECLPYPIICPKGEHPVLVNGVFDCTLNNPYSRIPSTPSTCDSKYYNGPCPPTDSNAYLKCASAALAANDLVGELKCAPLLPDNGPDVAYLKCASVAAAVNDITAELKCASLLPSNINGAVNATTTSPTVTNGTGGNTTVVPSSGGKGTGSSCTNNCTIGTPPLPTVDCTKNPNDPSCPQTMTPSTATPPSTSGKPTSPTTKTCPDGSVIDASATCPIPPATSNNPAPNNNPTPPSNNPSPPPSNNPSPPSSSNNGGGGSSSSGSGGSGSSSGTGSVPFQ